MSSSPGWYPQPDGNQRYFDGNEWTEHVRTPEAAGAAAPQTPPAKKSGMMKWIVIGIIGIVVLCCCGGAAISLGGEGDNSSSSETTTTSEAATSESTEGSEPAEESESKKKASPAAKKSSSSSPSPKKTSKSASPAGPDHTVTAGELIKEFEDNELAGDQKYKGKTIQVSGVVEKIDTELFEDDKYLLNITDGGDFEFLSVTCHDMSNDVLSELAVGNSVTVIGDFDDGGDLGVDLKDCKVA